MKAYLIRHAKTVADTIGRSQRFDSPIVIDQATIDRANSVRAMIGEVDVIYSSPMQRAMETSRLIFGDKDVNIVEYIHEYPTPTELIDAPRDHVINYWEGLHKQDKMDISWVPEGGESFQSLVKRVTRFHKYVVEQATELQHNSIAIVGHGTFMRHLLLSFAGVDWSESPQLIFDVLRKLRWDNLDVIEVDI